MIQQIVAAPFCKLTVRCGKPTTHVEYLPIKWIKNQLLEQGSSAPPESLQAIPGVRASSTVAQWTAAQQWHVSGRWLVSPNLPPVVFTPKIAWIFFLDVKKHPFYMGHGVFECFRLMSKGHLSHLALRLAAAAPVNRMSSPVRTFQICRSAVQLGSFIALPTSIAIWRGRIGKDWKDWLIMVQSCLRSWINVQGQSWW